RGVQVDRLTPLASRGSPFLRSILLVVADVRRRMVRRHSGADGTRCIDLSGVQPPSRRVEIRRAALTDHVNQLPLWWSTPLDRLFCACEWQILRAEGCGLVRRWGIVRVPELPQLACESQQEGPFIRSIKRSQKIRMRLGGSGDLRNAPSQVTEIS